ncbi:MAG: sulfur oxidation c-type cytochrome SoxX [Betaproteobacteria bacterium]|nr:sulfur oxidation c-type cytochrome SoxX [Betaproteobacteria bacterium]
MGVRSPRWPVRKPLPQARERGESGPARRFAAAAALSLCCHGVTHSNENAPDRIDTPLVATPGDAGRGQRIFAERDGGHCVLCHAAPGITQAGNIGPALHGVGARLSSAQIRLRIVDITRVNPGAVMPAFHRTTELNRVAPERKGQPILPAQQVEDLVAWLSSLK